MNSLITKKNIPLIIIFISAILLRFSGITSRPIWYDEAFAILFAQKGFSAMLYGTLTQTSAGAADIHPLGYYTILWNWIILFGTSIASARTLSILFSLFSLYLIYKITSHLLNKKTALYACTLFAILPFQIHYAQEIRMYATLTFWLLLATYAFLKAKTNWKWWVLFSISCALAQYTHNLASVYLISLSLTPILQRDWKTLRNLILAGLVSLTLYLPWLIHLPAQLSKVNAHYWVKKPGIEKLFTLILFYLPHLPLPNSLLIIGLLFAMLIITLAFFQTYLSAKNKLPNTNYGLWLAYLAFFPPLLLWAISQFTSVYIERALLASHAIFCIWLAWALTETKAPKIIQTFTLSLVVTCASIGFWQHLTYKGFPYADYQTVNHNLQNQIQTGDVIIHSSKLSYLPSFYFDPTIQQGFILDPENSDVDTLAPATRQILGLTEYANIETATKNSKRVWLVIYQDSLNEYTSINAIHPHIEFMNSNFNLENIEEWGNLRLYLYIPHQP